MLILFLMNTEGKGLPKFEYTDTYFKPNNRIIY